MAQHRETAHVQGPWSLSMCRRFWEGFTPAALDEDDSGDADELRTVFLAVADWKRVEARVTQHNHEAHIEVTGEGDLAAAADQVKHFLALDVDARGWPKVGRDDPVIGKAQKAFPGLRPCGFYSPYEAAAWSVLSQRIQMSQAAHLRDDLTDKYGEDGAFPTPRKLLSADLDLPGRKPEYLQAVATAALDGVLDVDALRSVEGEEALASLQEIKGIGPFASELVLLRGANAPDLVPGNEKRLQKLVAESYGAKADLSEVSQKWRPFRTWAAFHLRAMGDDS